MTITISCHCGANRIELPRPPERAAECNCTYCAKTGAVWGYYQPEDLRVISADEERIYDPNNMNRHHFCGRCGGNLYNDTPDWGSLYNMDGTLKNPDGEQMPTQRSIGINLRLADNFDWTVLEIEKLNGRNSW